MELLTTQYNRSRVAQKANAARVMLNSGATQAKISRLSTSVKEAESRSQAARALLAITSSETLDERFANLEQNDQIEALLEELKHEPTKATLI